MKALLRYVWDTPNEMGQQIGEAGYKLHDILPQWNLDMARTLKEVVR